MTAIVQGKSFKLALPCERAVHVEGLCRHLPAALNVRTHSHLRCHSELIVSTKERKTAHLQQIKCRTAGQKSDGDACRSPALMCSMSSANAPYCFSLDSCISAIVVPAISVEKCKAGKARSTWGDGRRRRC